MTTPDGRPRVRRWNRRAFLKASLALGGLALGVRWFFRPVEKAIVDLVPSEKASEGHGTFIGRSASYNRDIATTILNGLKELGINPGEIKGKRILLKPNLVETQRNAIHINTHPMVVQGAIRAFLTQGASSVVVAEGPGHCRDTLLVLEESGMGEVLYSERIPFVDLNYAKCYKTPNATRLSPISQFSFPDLIQGVDWIVSMPKMKTHHWGGVTLSLKNLFGVMPGSIYGWPKNVLHWAGIEPCIIDINATLRPHFSIVDGIVGMEGDGPIMGKPKAIGVIVMGRNLTSVDATCVRIMGIDPQRVPYLRLASVGLGPIKERLILQRGESIGSVRMPFVLEDQIPAMKQLKEA